MQCCGCVRGTAAAVAAATATYPSSRGSSVPKRRRMQHRSEDSEYPENVGAAGAPHGSGTFNSPDSLTVRKIRPPRDSLPVRGMSQVQLQQTEHFIRFAVPFVHEKQGTGRLVQMDSLVTMRSIQDAAIKNDVESAVAEIGRTRVHTQM